MKKEKFDDYVYSTANELRKSKYRMKKTPGVIGTTAQGLFIEPFHNASFIRGADFAYKLLTGKR